MDAKSSPSHSLEQRNDISLVDTDIVSFGIYDVLGRTAAPAYQKSSHKGICGSDEHMVYTHSDVGVRL